MALNNGLPTNVITGALGNVCFYTANGNNIIRSRITNKQKTRTLAGLLNEAKFKVANNFGKLVNPWLPYIYSQKIPKSLNNSKNIGFFRKNLSDNFLYDNIKASGLTIGNGIYTKLSIISINSITKDYIELTWNNTTSGITFPYSTTWIDCFIFSENLTKFYYYHKLANVPDGSKIFKLPNYFTPGSKIYLYILPFNEDVLPFSTGPANSIIPLLPITLIDN
jgi:hypothetical protein